VPTVKRIDSFQHQVLEAAAGVGWYPSVTDSSTPPVHNGNEITFDPTVVRTADHAVSFKQARSASVGVEARLDYANLTTDICVSFYFRTTDATNPSVEMILTLFGSTSNGTIALRTDGAVEARVSGGTTVVGSADVADGNWHRIDARYNISTTSGTLNLQIDGVDEGTATGTVTVANIATCRMGSGSASAAYNIWYSDYVICAGADHPLGDHFCGMVLVGATGTHNKGSGAWSDQAGATSDAALLAAIDDAWDGTTPNLTQTGEDYAQQTANDAASYLEYTLATITPTLSAVWSAGVRALIAAEDSATGCVAQVQFVDSAGTLLGGTGAVDPSVSATIYTPYRAESITAAPAGGWSQSTLQACKIRFGFSSDAAPDVAFNAVMVEYVGVLGAAAPSSLVIPPGRASQLARNIRNMDPWAVSAWQ